MNAEEYFINRRLACDIDGCQEIHDVFDYKRLPSDPVDQSRKITRIVNAPIALCPTHAGDRKPIQWQPHP